MGEKESYDCIVVGAGPAGITAALVLAKAGKKVILVERGQYPGSKNVFGGILYSTVLNKLIPNFWEEAPVERHMVQKKFSLLSKDTEVGLDFRSNKYNTAPYNNSFTVLRSKFDKWYAQKAEEAGVLLITETVVDEVIKKDGKVIGVKTRREDGEIYAPAVICADGVNSLIAKSLGLRKKFSATDMIQCCKEVIALPEDVINDRFNFDSKEGAALEYFGESVKGIIGSGFIYTNKDSLSVGIGCLLDDFSINKVKPFEILDHFKSHPIIKKYIRGGKTIEYSAHMIPEYGFNKLPQMVDDGIIIIGDAAGLVNASLYKEGTNLAMASGMYAAQTVLEALEKHDFSKTRLESYLTKMNASFVMKDMKKYRYTSNFLKKNRAVLTEHPKILARILEEYFSVSNKSKADIRKAVVRTFVKEIGLIKSMKLMFDTWRKVI